MHPKGIQNRDGVGTGFAIWMIRRWRINDITVSSWRGHVSIKRSFMPVQGQNLYDLLIARAKSGFSWRSPFYRRWRWKNTPAKKTNSGWGRTRGNRANVLVLPWWICRFRHLLWWWTKLSCGHGDKWLPVCSMGIFIPGSPCLEIDAFSLGFMNWTRDWTRTKTLGELFSPPAVSQAEERTGL